jgi:hypothetical protein
VELAFPHPEGNQDEEPAIDFEFATRSGEFCERVAVTGPPDPGWYTAGHDDAFGLGHRFLVPTHPVGHLSFLIPFQIGFRHRIGEFDLSINPGVFVLAACESGACRPGQRGTEPGLGIPFGVGATWHPGNSKRLGVELRLDEYAVWVPLHSGTRFTLIHAPAGVFHFSLIPNDSPGYPRLPRIVSLDIEAPVGLMAAREETGNRVAPYFGGAVSVWFWH